MSVLGLVVAAALLVVAVIGFVIGLLTTIGVDTGIADVVGWLMAIGGLVAGAVMAVIVRHAWQRARRS
jgi:membrane associated rhomboid family serine protease